MVKIHKREGGYMVGQECNTAVQMPHANFVSRLLYLPRGISRLEKLGQRKVFPKNHMLVQAGTKPNYCYIVKTGRVGLRLRARSVFIISMRAILFCWKETFSLTRNQL